MVTRWNDEESVNTSPERPRHELGDYEMGRPDPKPKEEVFPFADPAL